MNNLVLLLFGVKPVLFVRVVLVTVSKRRGRKSGERGMKTELLEDAKQEETRQRNATRKIAA